MEDLPPTESQKTNRWEIIGKTAVVVTILGGIIAGIIALYDFVTRKSPALAAEVRVTTVADYHPGSLIKELGDKINHPYKNKFILSFDKQDYLTQYPKNTALFGKFDSFLDTLQNEHRRALLDLLEIEQSIKVFIGNQGQRQAESVSIELPIGSKGYYRIDGLETKPFEQKIDVGNIRAEKLLLIEIWLRKKSIEAKDVVVAHPDGSVPISEPSPDRTWCTYIPILIIVLETIFILVLLVRWPKNKQPESDTPLTEAANGPG